MQTPTVEKQWMKSKTDDFYTAQYDDKIFLI